MKTDQLPVDEIIEGNVTEIDLDNRYILLEDRTGKPFVKIFWSKNKEIFDDKPTQIFNQIRKIKVGYYIAPSVIFEEVSTSGGLKEANLYTLPYKERPADFPKMQRKGWYGGKNNYQPRNEKIIVLQSTLKACAEVFAVTTTPESMDFDMAMDLLIARAIKDTDTLMAAGKVD